MTVPDTRAPAPSRVHTGLPIRTDSTVTGPLGVSIAVPSARQIGQIGSDAAAWFSTVITPAAEIVPAVRVPSAAPSGGCAR